MYAKLGHILGDYLVQRLGRELRDQGHSLTGDLIQSLEYKVRENATGVGIDFLANQYGEYLNTGVPASRIPYKPGGPKRGGTSKYIQALIRYVERRMGLRGKEATGVAFAIARRHSREGMPTRASYRFSKNSRRTGWVDVVIENETEKIEQTVTEFVGRELEALFFKFVTQKAA